MIAMSPMTSNDFDTSGTMLDGSCCARTSSSDPTDHDLEANFSFDRFCLPRALSSWFCSSGCGARESGT